MTMSIRSNSSDLPGRTGLSAVVGALVVAFAAAALFAFSPSLNPLDLLTGRFLEVSVPEVRGLTQQKALVQLLENRLAGDVEFAFDADAPIGTVIRQRPLPDASVRRDSTVEVTVSRGPAFVPIPELVGAPREDAVSRLKSLDLLVEESEVHDEEAAANTVLSVDPAPGVVVAGGSTVRLVVSKGPEVRFIPDLVGIPLEGGAFFLGRGGLTLGNVTYLDSADIPKGAIIALSPPPNTQVERDTPVDVTVSNGKPPLAVPNVVGKSQSEATRLLGNAGFVIGEVAEVGAVDDPAAGSVRAQVPPAGTLARPGDIVTITVRRAAPPPTTVPETTTPPTTAPAPTAPPAGGAPGVGQ